MSRTQRYNSHKARALVARANAVLVAATGIATMTGAAAAGSGFQLVSFHYTLMGITASLAGLAITLLEAARRAEIKSGLAGLERPARPQMPRWTGNQPAGFVPPMLPQPSVTAPVPALRVPALPAPALAPVYQPVPDRPIRTAPVPAPTNPPVPVAEVAEDVPVDHELAGQS